jgi:[ribosomal protein S5]-alanine N-acetyltransferase
MSIETASLSLIPYSPDDLLALIEGSERFKACFGMKAAEGMQEFMGSSDISPDWLAKLRASSLADADPWLWGFAIVHRESKSVIGNVGFKGLPDEDAAVEIAYGLVPAFQGRGYATEAAEAVIAFAVDSGRVRRLRAHTLPTANASTRVLSKCGFQFTGPIKDPEDGLVWRWERGIEAT